MSVATHHVPSPSGAGETLLWTSVANSSYRIEVTCPRCAIAVEHISTGSAGPSHQAAVVKCLRCGWEGAISVELSSIREGSVRRIRRQEISNGSAQAVSA